MRIACRTRRSGGAHFLAAAVLAAALTAGCAGTKGSEIPVTEVTAKPDAKGVQVVDVEVHSYYYEPSRIVVEAGKPVELVLHFKSLFVPHNFTCEYPEAGIEVSRSTGFLSFHRTKRARFTPTAPGEYRFYCHVGSHRKKGMAGTLVVQ
jgi:plastocyanin